jgi:hypothetical protein
MRAQPPGGYRPIPKDTLLSWTSSSLSELERSRKARGCSSFSGE